ncbi:MAG: cation diffusion facilitator family transporter [Clostridia bacterium]|nr:cation diffusion facilitator family transporter [Clostridia bacterium]
MIDYLIKRFVKDHQDISNPLVRERYGRLAGSVGILTNFFLFCIKLLAGTLFHSIAITADAVNNLSDAGSSIITLVGFRMASKPADEKHPYGHARGEYITGFIVSFVIFVLGLELIRTSFDKIIHPGPIDFSMLSVVILVVAIGVKVWQSHLYRTLGKKINSTALVATSMDSRNDVLATSSVLVATIFAKLTGIQIDGYMGVVVALFIIFSGIKLIGETLNPLLGLAPDKELVDEVEQRILSYEGVLGLHDLVVHNYGPDKVFASVHVEVPAHQDLLESHELIDTIERDFLTKENIHLVIHMDPIVTDDEMTNILRQQVNQIIKSIDPKLSMHDFRMIAGKTRSNLVFDVTIPASCTSCDEQLRSVIQKEVAKINPDYQAVITLDRNYSSTVNI